jgi:hypothetical protein
LFRLSILLCAFLTMAGMEAARADDQPDLRLVMPGSVEVSLGARVPVSVALVPGEEFRIDRNGPLRIDLKVAEGSGLKLKKRRLRWSDAVDKSPRFVIPIEGSRVGQESLSIEYRAWVCRAKICRALRGSGAIQVEVKAAPPEAGVGDAGVPPGDP